MSYTNKVTLLLLATQKEFNNGDVHKCLDKYFQENAISDYSIDLHISFNQGSALDYESLKTYENHNLINKVFILNQNLSDFDDMYIRNMQEFRIKKIRNVPPLGASSGPNNLFFKSLHTVCKSDYENILMIEPDSRPTIDNWLDGIVSYCDNSFCIAGSIYKGVQVISEFETWSGHLNGIALYKNTPETKYILAQTEELIKYHVKHNINRFISFDVGIHYFSQTRMFYKYFENKNLTPLLNCDIITNYSLDSDIYLSIDEILEDYPNTIILHQKWN
jgi:hypothetical protein